MSENPSSIDKASTNCLFCAWLNGEGARPPVVFEDDQVIATLCESPISKGHTQILFKTHYGELADVAEHDAKRLGEMIPRLSKAIKLALGAEMIYVACISEEVRHVHFHLVPRYGGDTKGFTHFTRERQQLVDVEETVDRIILCFTAM